MTALHLALCQYRITRVAGLDAYAARLDALLAEAAGADLLVLPEYASLEAAAVADPPDVAAELAAAVAQADAMLDIMRAAARRHGVWLLAGSLPMRGADGRVHNCAPLFDPEGRVAFQQKQVMTRFERESWQVAPGAPPSVFATPWGRIGVAICYDVEFPTLVRAQVAAGAWLILAPSCTDTLHGFNRVLLSARARALENQCYVAVAPTVGNAPWSATLDANRGHAAVLGPVDRGFPEDGVLARGALDEGMWLHARLDPARLEAVRESGAVRNHRDWPADPIPPCPVRTPA